MEEDIATYNQRMVRMWETTKFCNKLCKTVRFDQELNDDDKSCLTNCGYNAAMEKLTLDKFLFKVSKNASF